MTKNDSLTIKLIDEKGIEIGFTYPKRAKGLVKSGRASYIDDKTLRLTDPNQKSEVKNMTENSQTKPKGLGKILIPKYSLSEELMSSISHGIGALFSLYVLISCVWLSLKHNNMYALAGSIIYGLTSFMLYIVSTLYHALKPNRAKKVFRIIDHCSIYLLIAGTYAPYCLVTLRNVSPLVGWLVLVVVWICAIIGITFTAINMNTFKKMGMALYLIMGWVCIFSFKTLVDGINKTGLIYMIIGGVVYTVGAILYGIGKKVKYMHSIFHFFVLAASIMFYLSIIQYVL